MLVYALVKCTDQRGLGNAVLARFAKRFVERCNFVLASRFALAVRCTQHGGGQNTSLRLVGNTARAAPSAHAIAWLAFGHAGEPNTNSGHRHYEIRALLRCHVVRDPTHAAFGYVAAVWPSNRRKRGVKHRAWAAKRHHNVRSDSRTCRDNRHGKLCEVGARERSDIGDQRRAVGIVGSEFWDVDVVEPVDSIGDSIAHAGKRQTDAFKVKKDDTAIAAHPRINGSIRWAGISDRAIGGLSFCVNREVWAL